MLSLEEYERFHYSIQTCQYIHTGLDTLLGLFYCTLVSGHMPPYTCIVSTNREQHRWHRHQSHLGRLDKLFAYLPRLNGHHKLDNSHRLF